jgi:hypothetical protein
LVEITIEPLIKQIGQIIQSRVDIVRVSGRGSSCSDTRDLSEALSFQSRLLSILNHLLAVTCGRFLVVNLRGPMASNSRLSATVRGGVKIFARQFTSCDVKAHRITLALIPHA